MHQVKRGIAICTPIPYVRRPDGSLGPESITIDWHRARMALGFPTNSLRCEVAADGQEVGAARCQAVRAAREGGYEFLFFLDYDVIAPHDALCKLLYRARHFPDFDIFAGVYCSKSPIAEPLVYMVDGEGAYWDWAVGDLIFEPASVHMGLTLLRLSLFDQLEATDDNPWFKTRNGIDDRDKALGAGFMTEDIWFCRRAREEAGAKILVDTGVLAGHQDLATGVIYGLPEDSMPVRRARWLPRYQQDRASDPLRLAIDLGAGGIRRSWPGYKTETCDIRRLPGVDYVQDTRHLTLPDAHYDLVASSHHLEHLGRFEQEAAWREMDRILKPGGKMEHIVPNLQWAGAHLVDGVCDPHVVNVLYGAQESHGYERAFNTHYFGYTPEIARQLAEGPGGLEQVEIETYKEKPELGYHLIIRGRKPDTVLELGPAEVDAALAAPLSGCSEGALDMVQDVLRGVPRGGNFAEAWVDDVADVKELKHKYGTAGAAYEAGDRAAAVLMAQGAGKDPEIPPLADVSPSQAQ